MRNKHNCGNAARQVGVKSQGGQMIAWPTLFRHMLGSNFRLFGFLKQ